MSHTGFAPNDFAFWLSQQAQQGNTSHYQSLLNQFPIPLGSRPASYPATPQGQTSSANFSTNIGSSCPPGPFPNPFSMNCPPVQFPLQFPLAPLPYPGTSAPAYGTYENIQRPTPQYTELVQSDIRPSDYSLGSQQLVPSQSLPQNSDALSYRAQSVPTNLNLTTIHPTLGLCVLVPIGALSASAPQSPGHWTAASTSGSRRRDYYNDRIDRLNDRVDRLRRRHSRELTPYMRYMTPSPTRSYSPYLTSPSSSVTVTPILRHRHPNTPEYGRSPRRFHGIGGFTPLRSQDVPRPTIERSVSTVGTCSQCGAAGPSSPYEPSSDGSVAPTPRIARENAVVGQGESSRGHVEDRENPAEDRMRFQASVEEVDE